MNRPADLRATPPLYKAVLLAFGLLGFGLLFRELLTLLVAVLITVMIAIPLAAMATRLERYRVPRFLGALVGLLVGVGVLGVVLALVIPPFVEQLEEFVDEVPMIVEELQSEVAGLGDAIGTGNGFEAQQFLQGYVDEPERLIGPLASIGVSIAGVLAAILLMLITAYYMAVRPEPLVGGMVSLVPPARREWARGVMERLRGAWIGWMQGVLVDMVVTGALLYVGLSLIGLDFAIFFAVFSAILVIVPYFGAILGAIPPTLFALTDSVELAVLALAIYVLVQQVESNITIPLVMAERVKLHPAVVAVGVVIIGQLFGFIGLFVAVPLLSMIIILTDELWVKQVEQRALEPATPGEVREELAEPSRPRGSEAASSAADSQAEARIEGPART